MVTRVVALIVVEFVDSVFVDALICLGCTTNCSSTGVSCVKRACGIKSLIPYINYISKESFVVMMTVMVKG